MTKERNHLAGTPYLDREGNSLRMYCADVSAVGVTVDGLGYTLADPGTEAQTTEEH